MRRALRLLPLVALSLLLAAPARSQVLSGAGQPSLAQIESKLNELAQTAQQIVSAVRRFENS